MFQLCFSRCSTNSLSAVNAALPQTYTRVVSPHSSPCLFRVRLDEIWRLRDSRLQNKETLLSQRIIGMKISWFGQASNSANRSSRSADMKMSERSQLHRLARRLEESVWLPRSGKVSYIFRFDSPTDQLIELHPGVCSELETSI